MSPKASTSFLAALLFSSGISGLVYEVVWLRMLVRTFGVTIYAVSTVLFVFMAGLALGSWVAGKRIRSHHNALRYYAYAELAIGVGAALSTQAILLLPGLLSTTHIGEQGLLVVVVRAATASIVLLPPTFAMGATLPLLSEYLAKARGELGGQVGLLYGANTLGAVFGVVATGFFLLMWIGELRTVMGAAALNVSIGALAWWVSRGHIAAEPKLEPEPVATGPSGTAPIRRRLMWALGVSGFCALGCQIVWSRLLTLLLGNSVYAFSSMLGAYLLGIGLGSLLASRLSERLSRPLAVFAFLEMGAGLLAMAGLHLFVALGVANNNIDYTYSQIWQLSDFPRLGLHALLIVLPVTTLLGAAFPLVAKVCAEEGFAGETVGKLYAYNTIGAMAGSLVTGFLLVDALGTLKTFLLICAGWFAVGMYVFRLAAKLEPMRAPSVIGLVSILAFVGLGSVSFEDPFFTVLRARTNRQDQFLAHIEDKTATLSVLQARPPNNPESGPRHLFINGLLVSSTDETVGGTMIFMPLVFHPDPKASLIIGLGVGEAFRASIDHGLETTVVDLVPAVRDLFAIFHPTDYQAYLSSPRAHFVFGDGRNALLSSHDKFDLILVDGTPPVFASGMVNLYSAEFARLAHEHLSEEGLFALWFPTVCFESDFWMVARSFVEAFPHVQFWAAPGWSGIILIGSNSRAEPFQIGSEEITARLTARDPKHTLHGVDAESVRRGLILSEAQIRDKARAYPMLTDDRPYTEFPLEQFWRHEPYLRDNGFAFKLAASLRARAE